eukprot:324619-Amphidinium_carterae.1
MDPHIIGHHLKTASFSHREEEDAEHHEVGGARIYWDLEILRRGGIPRKGDLNLPTPDDELQSDAPRKMRTRPEGTRRD